MTKKRAGAGRPSTDLISKLQATTSKLRPILEAYANEFYDDAQKEAWDEFALYSGAEQDSIEYETVFPTWFLYNWHYMPLDEDEDGEFEEGSAEDFDEEEFDDEEDFEDEEEEESLGAIPIALQYLTESETVSVAEKDFILAACEAPFSLFLVEEITSPTEVVLKDLLLNESHPVVVLDAPMTFQQNTIIYGRVMDIEGNKVLYGVSPFALNIDALEWVIALASSIKTMEGDVTSTILHGWDMEVRDNFYESLAQQFENEEDGSNIRPLQGDEDEAILDENLLADPSVQGLLEVILSAKATEIADTSMPELGNQSPRQLVTTQIGRAQVEEFLQWAKAEAPNPAVAVIMDRLLRQELGMDAAE